MTPSLHHLPAWRQAAGALLLLAAGSLAPAAHAAKVPAVQPGEVLVKLRSGDALPGVLARHRLTVVERFGARPLLRLKMIDSTPLADKLAALALDADVQLAEPNHRQQSPEAKKNNVWAIGTRDAYVAQWSRRAIRLPGALRLATGVGVRVAVLDTGVDGAHPALAGRLLPGRDFVDGDDDPSEAGSVADAGYGHGTHVAGLIALTAPGAKIMPLRVLDARGAGTAWALAAALLHAVDPDGNAATDDGAHVINLSLGSRKRTRLMETIAVLSSCADPAPNDPAQDFSDPGYNDDRSRCANSRGVVVVAAAGNDGSDRIREYPAAESAYGLLSVAATQAGNTLADFSNRGGWISLAAPGQGLTSAVPGGQYATWSGTSMAAPLVAGTVALVRSARPTLTAKDAARCVERHATVVPGGNMDRLDALLALRAARAGDCD